MEKERETAYRERLRKVLYPESIADAATVMAGLEPDEEPATEGAE